MKLSFKKQPKETGLAGVGYPYQSVLIKADKLEVGLISAPNWRSKDSLWTIRLAKKKDHSFVWITLKFKGENEDECRQYLKDNWEAICKEIPLHQFKD